MPAETSLGFDHIYIYIYYVYIMYKHVTGTMALSACLLFCLGTIFSSGMSQNCSCVSSIEGSITGT